MTQIVLAVVGGGVLGALIAWWRYAWWARKPEQVEARSLAVVAQARDELAEDLNRHRQMLIEERTQHAEDRVRWSAEKAALIAEIDTLWTQVADLRKRAHAMPDPGTTTV